MFRRHEVSEKNVTVPFIESESLVTQEDIRVSKFLSLVLRHRPEIIGMNLDRDGWLPIDELIKNANQAGRRLDRDRLMAVVRTNDKQRFAISEDGTKIRASQGHSVRSVELDMPKLEPPKQLYHGTVEKFLPSIRKDGLLKGARNHVHLSADRQTATTVGSRRGTPVILVIESERMHTDDFSFFLSQNEVWLTDCVPVKYLRFPE